MENVNKVQYVIIPKSLKSTFSCKKWHRQRVRPNQRLDPKEAVKNTPPSKAVGPSVL